jgi:5'-nucleotidase / UDP-sugar diphosphatase
VPGYSCPNSSLILEFKFMRRWILPVLIFLVTALVSSCAPLAPVIPAPSVQPTALPTFTPGGDSELPEIPMPPVLEARTKPAPTEAVPLPDDTLTLTVLYTNDEHGWMEGMEPGQGAAELAGLWQEKFGYEPGGAFLVLSGGDNWTGPAVSTWFDGQSMVDVMNVMGYQASVIGNHEFDFGLGALQARLEQAEFPYLSANLRRKVDGKTPTDLGIQPFSVVDVAGVQVGLIGLTLTDTPTVTNPVNVAEFDFLPYEQVLREMVPLVRQAGAELILVPAHLCLAELRPLARAVADLDIALFGAGHCNEFRQAKEGGAVILAGGYHFDSYGYAVFSLDPASKDVLAVDYGVELNRGGVPDASVQAVVAAWVDEAESELNKPVGYLAEEIPRHSLEMQNLITGAWLWSYPNADVALTNLGGMRASLPAGELSLADIVSVMPFDNVLVEVKLTGAQLLEVLTAGNSLPAVGGLRFKAGDWVVLKTGASLDMQQTYSVLVNDFMYAGGDDYTSLALFDPQGYNTAIDWRQPVIDWVLAQTSTPQNPLDPAIDALNP